MPNRRISPVARLYRPALECDPNEWPGSLFRRVAVQSIRRALRVTSTQREAAERLGLDPTRLWELLRDFPELRPKDKST